MMENKRPSKKATIGERENLWFDLLNSAAVGVYCAADTGEFLFVNPRLAHIFGCKTSEEFLSAVPNLSTLFGYIDEGANLFLELGNMGAINKQEVLAWRPDGGQIWISINSQKKTRSPVGDVFEGFINEIMRRKLVEDSILQSERRFRMLVEQAGDAFFIHDYEGRIFDVNLRACNSLGYTRDELLSKRITDIDLEIQEKQHKKSFWERLTSGKYITFEGIHKRKNGSTFPVEVRLGRLDLGQQKLFLSLTRDITGRKQAEDTLRNAFDEITKLKNRLERENVHLRQEIELQYRHERIVGESSAINQVLHEVEKVAREETYVLIQGETGTGKELLARTIHNISPRKGRSMITVNCAALPSTLIESELFGRERGAFTGAVSRQRGRFEAANRSTLFLDEIGELPLELQAKLLRVLQDGQFERLGSSETISVDVRIIAATNKNLAELVEKEKFRRDLYYRLNVFPIIIPPLRERREDIPLLVWAFVRELEQSMGKKITSIPKKTMELLRNYSWPGNVRELRNVIERAMILSTGQGLHVDRFGADHSVRTKSTLYEIERDHILQTLKSTGWRVSGNNGAAKRLGLKESTLRARMKKLDIKRPV